LDTRSDVYALGVILYQLLAGRLPYDLSCKPHEVAQTIGDADPTPLGSVSRVYRGDIETIVAKAMEKDKARRYASAAELAADIRHCLRDEPIAARPPSASYQLRKLARRHKPLVAGIGAVFVVLVAGTAVSTWEAARANSESATAKAVDEFLRNDLLAQASPKNQARPGARPDPDLKVRTALDRAAARITAKFDKQPLVEASIRQTIAHTYNDLGLYREAQAQVERALDLRQRVLGGEHPDTLTTMHELASLYRVQAKFGQAEPLFLKILKVRRRVLGEEHPDTLDIMSDLAELQRSQGKYDQAEPLFTKVLEVVSRVQGKDHPDALASMSNLGSLYVDEGKYAQAEPLLTKALGGRRRVLGQEHPDTLASTNNLAMLYVNQGRYDEAEPLLTEALEVKRRVLGREHPSTLVSANNLGTLYTYQGRYAQAEPLLNKVLEVRRRVLGDENPDSLISMRQLAKLYRDERKYAQAEPLYMRVLELQHGALGAEHPGRLATMNDLAVMYLSQRKYAKAEPLIREAFNSWEKTAPGAWRRYSCQSLLGASLAGRKRYREAEPLLLSGYQGMRQREAAIPASSRVELERAVLRIVQLYRDWGKPEQAAEWHEKLEGTKPSIASMRP